MFYSKPGSGGKNTKDKRASDRWVFYEIIPVYVPDEVSRLEVCGLGRGGGGVAETINLCRVNQRL